jgi:hypothetical protein
MPALKQRMVQVNLEGKTLRGKTENYNFANKHRVRLKSIAKALVLEALNTSIEWLEERMDHNINKLPEELMERPRYSYAVILTGLDLLNKISDVYKIGLSERIALLKQTLVSETANLAVSLDVEKRWSEVDAVMDSLAQMASLTRDGSDTWIIEGKHYMAIRGKLYLDTPICHAIYQRYQRVNRRRIALDDHKQFVTLLKQEPYFLSDTEILDKMVSGRTVISLDLDLMKQKGIVTSMFTG